MSSLWGRRNGTALTGTLTVANANTSVTGSSTLFQSELKVGALITIQSVEYQVTAIASNTALTIYPAANSAATANTVTVRDAPKYVTPTEAADITLVTTSAAQSQTNGKNTPGWVKYKSYTTNGGANTRRIVETLIPLKS